MKPSSKDFENVLKQSVVDYFLSNYSRILKDGLVNFPITDNDVSSIAEAKLHPVDGSNDQFTFDSDFKVKTYMITFHGTVNVNKEITNEAFSGKKDFFL